MSHGPMSVQPEEEIPSDPGAAADRVRASGRVRRLRVAAAVAAFAIAEANFFAAGGVARARPPLGLTTDLARKAFALSPIFGRAAFGTAIVATTSSVNFGSRRPRKANNRSSALPPGRD